MRHEQMDSNVDVLILILFLLFCAYGLRHRFPVLQGVSHGYDVLKYTKAFPQKYRAELVRLLERVVMAVQQSGGDHKMRSCQDAANVLEEYMNECIMFHPNNLVEINAMKASSIKINELVKNILAKANSPGLN